MPEPGVHGEQAVHELLDEFTEAHNTCGAFLATEPALLEAVNRRATIQALLIRERVWLWRVLLGHHSAMGVRAILD